MKMVIKFDRVFPALLALLLFNAAQADAGSPLGGPLRETIGVNIHFTHPAIGELEMLRDAGFGWVRMDLSWGGTERIRGKYNFSDYDNLVQQLDKNRLRALLILDYTNALYDGGVAPHTEAGRAAFASWADAAVHHLRGRRFVWEIWNEPNGGSWKPEANPQDYAELAETATTAIRRSDPEEMVIGPALSGMDFKYLQAVILAGGITKLSAVSIHPYRPGKPETVAADYQRIQSLTALDPRPAAIPLISGEWGYSSVPSWVDETVQAKYFVREMLSNVAAGIPLSIWYDWHDDGLDHPAVAVSAAGGPTSMPKGGWPRFDPENHFGLVRYHYHPNADLVYDPKPAYLAAKTLLNTLGDFYLDRRLSVGGKDDYVLLFTNGNRQRLACWTTAAAPHEVRINGTRGKVSVINDMGQAAAPVAMDSRAKELSMMLTDAVQYLILEDKSFPTTQAATEPTAYTAATEP